MCTRTTKWLGEAGKLLAFVALACLLPGVAAAGMGPAVLPSAGNPLDNVAAPHFDQALMVTVSPPPPVMIALAGPMVLAMADLKPHFSYQWRDEVSDRNLSLDIELRDAGVTLPPDSIDLTPWRSGSKVLTRLKDRAVFRAFAPDWKDNAAVPNLARYSFTAWQEPDPAVYDLGPFTARLLSPRGQSGGMLGPSAYQPSTSPFLGPQGQIDDGAPNTAYVAMEWRTGPVGVTLGGGYAGSNLTTTVSESMEGSSRGGTMRSTALNNNSSAGITSRYDASSRWAAFMSVPYRLSESISLGPEFTYYYLNVPAESTEVNNEWVMGLQMRFDF